ncbi:hypothetical protein HDU88_000453 [Geranomyces variabilis]|nr:hypothetical protein HDU88_000453 [Geranomyces variabilis]
MTAAGDKGKRKARCKSGTGLEADEPEADDEHEDPEAATEEPRPSGGVGLAPRIALA